MFQITKYDLPVRRIFLRNYAHNILLHFLSVTLEKKNETVMGKVDHLVECLLSVLDKGNWGDNPFLIKYSEIPLLRPPKIKTFYPLKTLFAKFR